MPPPTDPPPPRRAAARPAKPSGREARSAPPAAPRPGAPATGAAFTGPGDDDDARRLRGVFRSLADLAPVAIWITEGERIVYANSACAELFAVEGPQALIGVSPFALISPDARAVLDDGVRHALGGRLARPICERIRRADGEERVVEIAVSALPDHGRTTVQMVIRDITEPHQALQRGAVVERQLRRLSTRLVQAREDERRHIARELHDELGQWLTALKMELSGLARDPAPGPLEPRVVPLIGMVDEVLRTVRRIATDLRPPMLDELGLLPALKALARDTEQRLGLGVTLELACLHPAPDDATATTLYRIVQEALTNVARHAHARHVWIGLEVKARRLVLRVRDDGVGLGVDPLHSEHAHGLLGIEERARMLGGQLDLGKGPEGGACLSVSLPWLGAPTDKPRARARR